MRAGGGMTNDETKGKELRRDPVMAVDQAGRVADYVIDDDKSLWTI